MLGLFTVNDKDPPETETVALAEPVQPPELPTTLYMVLAVGETEML